MKWWDSVHIRRSSLQIPLFLLPNPYITNVWGTRGQLTKDMVTDCLRKGLFKAYPIFPEEDNQNEWLHATRVTYFVKYGWEDLICAQVQWTDQGEPYIHTMDGAHRLAAALYLEQETIQALYDETVSQLLTEKGF